MSGSPLEEAQKSLRLSDVYFRGESVVVADEVTPPFWPSVGRTLFRMKTSVINSITLKVEDANAADGETEFLEVEFQGAVRCLPAGEETEDESGDLLRMEVSIGLLYERKHICSEAALDEFVRMNAPYHAIPYWREHVHGVCAKRRFPPVTIPLYSRAMPKQAAANETTTDAVQNQAQT